MIQYKRRKQVYNIFHVKGSYSDLTLDDKVYIIQNLYNLNLAEAYFIGMGWPEGYQYCSNPEYLKLTGIPALEKMEPGGTCRKIWFAIRFVGK